MNFYLCIQIGKEQPTITPFNTYEEMKKYVKEKLNDRTVVAMTENLYVAHIREDEINESK